MGYSHYYGFKLQDKKGRTIYYTDLHDIAERFESVAKDFGEVLKVGPQVELVAHSDDRTSRPYLGARGVFFNGFNEGGHETFSIDIPHHEEYARVREGMKRTFNFCKTAMKPYDLYVMVAILLIRKHFGPDFWYESDGNEKGWKPAIDLLKKVFPDIRWTFAPSPE